MAGGARPILGLLAIALLAGGIVLQFFVILSGLDHSPLNKVYFLQADTAGITGGSGAIPNPTRWTYLAICGVMGSNNANCGPKRAALPFDPQSNFHTSTGVPSQFVGTSHYFLLSRFAWVFYLIALFFAVVAFLLSVFALFARLGAYLTGFTAFLAVFFQALAASLMTAWTYQARKAFRSNGQSARLGTYAYGFTWGAFAAFFLAALLFCIGGSVGKNNTTQKKSYFGRKKSTRSGRSRGSFVDSSSERRGGVKDDYD